MMLGSFKEAMDLFKSNYRYDVVFEFTSSGSGKPEYVSVARFCFKEMAEDFVDYLNSKYPGVDYKIEEFRLEY